MAARCRSPEGFRNLRNSHRRKAPAFREAALRRAAAAHNANEVRVAFRGEAAA
jgi:hypothetical protein